MASTPKKKTTGIIVRLEEATLAALNEAAENAGLSREAYIRLLIENQIGAQVGGLARRGAQPIRAPRYGDDSQDPRVLGARARRGKGAVGEDPPAAGTI